MLTLYFAKVKRFFQYFQGIVERFLAHQPCNGVQQFLGENSPSLCNGKQICTLLQLDRQSLVRSNGMAVFAFGFGDYGGALRRLFFGGDALLFQGGERVQRKQYDQTTSLDDVIGELDILYMTRVQGERFFNEQDYIRLRDSYILTPNKLESAKEDLIIMHPLPRVNEISVSVDNDPRACYFKQARYGKFVRMALIMKLLEVE